MQQQWQNAHLSGGSMDYVDAMYEEYLAGPNRVDKEWREFFDKLSKSNERDRDVSHKAIREYFLEVGKRKRYAQSQQSDTHQSSEIKLSRASLFSLINAYRMHGHHQATLSHQSASSSI